MGVLHLSPAEGQHIGLRGMKGRTCQLSARSAQRARCHRAEAPHTTDRTYPNSPAVLLPPKQDSPRGLKANPWPVKSSLYLFRTDGKTCSRELVTGSGKLQFAHPSTQQQLLVWRDRPQSVMVIKKLGTELSEEFLQVVSYLTEVERMHVVVEPNMYELCVQAGIPMDGVFTFTPLEADRLADHVDFVCCLGGDGVILHASALFKGAIPPVVSFHLGSMGFLTNHEYIDYKRSLRQVIYGCQKLETCNMESMDLPPDANRLGVMVTLRMRLECSIVRRRSKAPEQVYEVLNEVVLDRGSNSFLTNIECYISGRLITRVQADGIMLATPTGSTAYSVAAGGSMVHPNVPAILLTPICPHSLNFRPVVLPDYVELELRVPESARVSAWVCFDGKRRQELHRGDSVFVKMSENPVPTINKEDLTGDWFQSLERCFKWSNRTVQKHLPVEYLEEAAAAGAGPSSYGDTSQGQSAAAGAATTAAAAVEAPSTPTSSAAAAAGDQAHGGFGGGGVISSDEEPLVHHGHRVTPISSSSSSDGSSSDGSNNGASSGLESVPPVAPVKTIGSMRGSSGAPTSTGAAAGGSKAAENGANGSNGHTTHHATNGSSNSSSSTSSVDGVKVET